MTSSKNTVFAIGLFLDLNIEIEIDPILKFLAGDGFSDVTVPSLPGLSVAWEWKSHPRLWLCSRLCKMVEFGH